MNYLTSMWSILYFWFKNLYALKYEFSRLLIAVLKNNYTYLMLDFFEAFQLEDAIHLELTLY
jgi:hypothetical protein